MTVEPRRIIVVGMNYAPEITGCGRYTGDLAQELAQRGHQVSAITTPPHYPGWEIKGDYRNRYSSEELDGVRVYRCPVLLKKAMGGIWRLIAPVSFALSAAPVTIWRILRDRPDAVMVVEPTLMSAPAALLAAKIVGARTTLHVQDLEVDAAFAVGHLASIKWLTRLAGVFERACLKAFDRVVTISSRMSEKIAEKGVDPERVVVVRNWVDVDHIHPIESSEEYRAELGLPRDGFVVLYSGNMGPKQGLDSVVDAARLLRDNDRIIFALAGEGPSRPALVAQAADLPNVKFLPFQPYARLGEFLGLADVHILPQLAAAGDLVLPSKLGGMLASGRPIVVAAEADTELATFVADAATIVRPEDAGALGDALRSHEQEASRGNVEGRLSLARRLSRGAAINQFQRALLEEKFEDMHVGQSKMFADNIRDT